LFPDSVYVFTPKSQIQNLPKGATALDFAYAIHTRIGDRSIGAKVNGETVALRTPLRNGDVVEILTNDAARPEPGWLSFVKTGRARSKIRHHLRARQHSESVAFGEQLLKQALRAEGHDWPEGDEVQGPHHGVWQALLRWSGNRTRQELLLDIGLGTKIATVTGRRMAHLLQESGNRANALTLTLGRFLTDDNLPMHAVVTIDGNDNSPIEFARCCHPIPGDEITGYMGRGDGLTIHTSDCTVLRHLLEKDRERSMQVEWSDEPCRSFDSVIQISAESGNSLLARLAQAVSNAAADIAHIQMRDEGSSRSVDLQMRVQVRDRVHLAEVLRLVRRVQGVTRVSRSKRH